MAKRFTATDKWRKGFFKGLSTLHKLLWLYIVDECDHAGFWDVELDVASIRIGEDVTGVTVGDFCGKIIEIDGGKKWFVVAFFEYQYGAINDKVNAQRSALARIQSQLYKKQYQQFINPSLGVKDKDKDKDKEEEKASLERFDRWWLAYGKSADKAKTREKWLRLKPEEQQACLDAAPAYVASTPDLKYRKSPLTYLNGRNWEDEVQPDTASTHQPQVYVCQECGDKQEWFQGLTLDCGCSGKLVLQEPF